MNARLKSHKNQVNEDHLLLMQLLATSYRKGKSNSRVLLKGCAGLYECKKQDALLKQLQVLFASEGKHFLKSETQNASWLQWDFKHASEIAVCS